jgi:hypothetical protein
MRRGARSGEREIQRLASVLHCSASELLQSLRCTGLFGVIRPNVVDHACLLRASSPVDERLLGVVHGDAAPVTERAEIRGCAVPRGAGWPPTPHGGKP